MKTIKLKCSNCGAKLEVNKDLDKINCNYCGEEILIDDAASELRRVEEVKLYARKKHHEETLREKKELKEFNAVDNFKKSKLSIFLLVFFVIAVALLFADTGILCKLITFVQAALFITSWLMYMRIIREPFNGLKVILAIVAFVLIIPIAYTNNSSPKEEYETIKWDYIVLKDELPKPNSEKGRIITNSDDTLFIYVQTKSEDDYRSYIEECKNFGYTVEAKTETKSYEAKNDKNYKIDLYYFDYNNEVRIQLETKKENTTTTQKVETTSTTKAATNTIGLRSDFKQAMDSYESFMNEYVIFMKKYKNNPADLTILNDYSNYTTKYADYVDKFNKWKSEELNTEELKYYIDVQTRINKKLAEIA